MNERHDRQGTVAAERVDGRLLDRACGTLYGVALGDAMGMPAEMWPRDEVLRYFGEIKGFEPGPPGHFIVDGYVAGQVTDDTQQTVMLAEAILGSGGRVVAAEVARHLVAWADRVGAAGGNFLGPSSKRAIEALRSGVPPEEAGAMGDTNGAAMRIAPVGILSPSADLDGLVDRVEAASLPTHGTNIAIAGAAMIAAAVSRAIDSDDLDEVLAWAVRAGEIGMARGRKTPGASLRRRTEWALERVRQGGEPAAVLGDLYDFIGAGVATTEAVPAALALVRLADGDPVRGALLCANLGGDTDTIGAMVGGICGAFSGLGAIPERYVTTLREVNGLELEPLAAGLAAWRATLR